MSTRVHTEAGWLAFESGDSSVLVEHALTSLPTAGDMGANTESNDADVDSNTADYFSSLGFLCNANYDAGAGVSGRLQYNYAGAALDALLTEGQLSVEVSRSWLCSVDPDSGSTNGLALAGTQQLLGFNAGSEDGEFFRRTSGASGTTDLLWNAVSCTTNKITGVVDKLNLNSLDKDDYIRLNLGWWREGTNFRVVWGINEVVMFDHIQAFVPTTSIAALRIGSATGGGFRAEDVYLKNFTLASTRPGVANTLPKAVFWGDSQTNAQSDGTLSGRPHDMQIVWEFAKTLAAAGHYCDIAIEENGGFYVSDDGTASFLLSGTLASLSSATPGNVICIAGTNDAREFSAAIAASFTTDYQSHIDAMKTFDNVGHVMTTNVLSFIGATSDDTVANRADRDTVNAEIAALSNVSVHIDAYQILGAEAPADYTFKGQYGDTPPLDDLHIGTQGAVLLGAEIGTKYLALPLARTAV